MPDLLVWSFEQVIFYVHHFNLKLQIFEFVKATYNTQFNQVKKTHLILHQSALEPKGILQ